MAAGFIQMTSQSRKGLPLTPSLRNLAARILCQSLKHELSFCNFVQALEKSPKIPHLETMQFGARPHDPKQIRKARMFSDVVSPHLSPTFRPISAFKSRHA